MMGIEIEGKPLMRAYSMASANYEDHLEFYSIKVQQGALTSRLQHIVAGDEILVSKKPTGTLLWDRLRPGKRLYLLSTYRHRAGAISVDHKRPGGVSEFRQVMWQPAHAEKPYRNTR